MLFFLLHSVSRAHFGRLNMNWRLSSRCSLLGKSLRIFVARGGLFKSLQSLSRCRKKYVSESRITHWNQNNLCLAFNRIVFLKTCFNALFPGQAFVENYTHRLKKLPTLPISCSTLLEEFTFAFGCFRMLDAPLSLLLTVLSSFFLSFSLLQDKMPQGRLLLREGLELYNSNKIPTDQEERE